MTKCITKMNSFLKPLGFCSLSLALLAGCTGKNMEGTEAAMTKTEVQKADEENDPEITVPTTSGPQDCVEDDKRPACNVTPRGLNFIPLKIQTETTHRCLRPKRGSTEENIEIVLDSCSNSQSRRWLKKDGVFSGGWKLENMHSGKCIERVGAMLQQRTCANSIQATSAHNQTWKFLNTPPFRSGDLLKSWTAEEGCMHATSSTTVRMSNCQNDSNRRWFQSAY